METTERPSELPQRRAHLAWRAGALAVWAALALRFGWVCDDAFISFRFARNWAAGLGPRFNPGEHVPVEGYTNFGWTALAALAEAAGQRPEIVMPVVSAGCAAVLLVRLHRLLAEDFALSPALAGLLLLGLASFPPFAVWSTSGMETMAFCLLLFVACEALVVRRTGRGAAAGLAALGAALVRFDGVAWGLAIAASALLVPEGRGRDGLRRVGVYLAILLAGFLAYFLWRFSYYEALVPNTVAAKVGFGAPLLARGGRYVLSHVLTFLSPLAWLAAFAPALRPRWRAWGLPVAALVVAGVAYPVATGGDFMAMGRFLLPATVFGALLLVPLHAEIAARRPTAALALAAALVLLAQPAGWNVQLVPRSVMQRVHFRLNVPATAWRSELEQWRFMKANARHWEQQGRAMAAVAAPGESWVVGPLGATAYFSGLTTWDQVGLVVPELAARRGEGPLASPGHDTYVPRSEMLFLEPDYLGAWLWTGKCMADPIDRELPPAGVGGLRAPEVAARYAPRLVPAEAPRLRYAGVLVMQRTDDAAERQALWAAFDADRPPPCRRAPRPAGEARS